MPHSEYYIQEVNSHILVSCTNLQPVIQIDEAATLSVQQINSTQVREARGNKAFITL